jgi:hypothetical protein
MQKQDANRSSAVHSSIRLERLKSTGGLPAVTLCHASGTCIMNGPTASKPTVVCLALLVMLFGCVTSQTSRTEAPTQSPPPTNQSEEKKPAGGQQAKSAGESPSPSQATGDRKPTPHGTEPTQPAQSPAPSGAPPTPEAELEKARENVRLSRETYARAADELERLKASGNATPEVVREYETYLDRLGEMEKENQEVLERMESAYKGRAPTPATPNKPTQSDAASAPGSSRPQSRMQDEVAKLDRELDESLAAADEKLLMEMQRIRSESAGRMRSLAEEAAAASKRIRESGAAAEEEAPEASDAREGESADQAGEQDSRDSSRGEKTAAKSGERRDDSATGMKQSTPASDRNAETASSQDDDIVARQLREAAEKETDPELKAKLWKEYEEYKKGRRE